MGTFASYDDFAHLLEGDSDDEIANKHLEKVMNKKRTYEQKETRFQKGGRESYKSKRQRR